MYRTTISLMATGLLAGLFCSMARAGGPACSWHAHPNDYCAHEWGTFTSMQGCDGTTLEGLEHEEEGLPDFVYSRTKVRDCPLRARGYKGLECDVEHVTEKMETPVIYFYSVKEQHVRVHVTMNHGLLTQWYPVVDKLGPKEGARDAGPLDMSKVEKSFLEWDVKITPRCGSETAIPSVQAGDPWAFARIPRGADLVTTMPRAAPRVGPVEAEKFLFYRGLGRFSLPLKAEISERSVTLSNGGDPIPAFLVIEVRNGQGAFSVHAQGEHARCVNEGGEASTTRTVTLPRPFDDKDARQGALDAYVPELERVLEDMLVTEGKLYYEEAVAMAKTWEKSYFRTEGLRILYIVPQKTVDEVLPLTLEPKPWDLVRVLVGRLECVTPEAANTVRKAIADRLSGDPAVRDSAEMSLARFGRFLEPHVRYVLDNTKLPSSREIDSAKEVLARARTGARS